MGEITGRIKVVRVSVPYIEVEYVLELDGYGKLPGKVRVDGPIEVNKLSDELRNIDWVKEIDRELIDN